MLNELKRDQVDTEYGLRSGRVRVHMWRMVLSTSRRVVATNSKAPNSLLELNEHLTN